MLETEFLIAICWQIGDKWPLKALFLGILEPRSSIFKSVFDCRLSGVVQVSKIKGISFFGCVCVQKN